MAPLKKDTNLFVYEKEYKRFSLGFNVKFFTDKFLISDNNLYNPELTINNINNVGDKLIQIIDSLSILQKKDTNLKDVSYLLIIAGYASHFNGTPEINDYILSYNRALHLWMHWRDRGINFEHPKYKDLIDLQISGNGWGGVGRFERKFPKDYLTEEKNQRFIIQIIPKIGDSDFDK